jgi:hypothetical protein
MIEVFGIVGIAGIRLAGLVRQIRNRAVQTGVDLGVEIPGIQVRRRERIRDIRERLAIDGYDGVWLPAGIEGGDAVHVQRFAAVRRIGATERAAALLWRTSNSESHTEHHKPTHLTPHFAPPAATL